MRQTQNAHSLASLCQLTRAHALPPRALTDGPRLRRRADITRDPAFRAQFHAMCAAAGVDPLASNKGFWAELLGFGDFYYELGVQIGALY